MTEELSAAELAEVQRFGLDRPEHDHEPEWCICHSLGSFSESVCDGECHTREVSEDHTLGGN